MPGGNAKASSMWERGEGNLPRATRFDASRGTMRLVVNGEERQCRAASIPELIEELGARADRVAILVNDDIVPAAQRAEFRLAEGDRVELLTFAGGG